MVLKQGDGGEIGKRQLPLKSAVARSSAVIPVEANHLLNPLHSSFAKIEIGEPQDFITDLRLVRK